jgi:hypothetical protein
MELKIDLSELRQLAVMISASHTIRFRSRAREC